jgi:hypothetical protein
VGSARRALLALVLVVLGAAGGATAWWFLRDDTLDAKVVDVAAARQGPAGFVVPAAAPRTTDVYAGQGAWVDAFDYSPPYTGPDPPIRPTVVGDMAGLGVRTLYLQAARLDARSPGLLEDRWLLTEFVLRAHQRGMRVVAWYLPKWSEDSTDLDHVRAMSAFAVLGHRFDGIAVDVEYTSDGLTPEERGQRLVALSRAVRAVAGTEAVGAIVLPPVVTEVVNTKLWPAFPWPEIAPLYDVWLPMSYWSNRTTRSGYKDGYVYTDENIRRLRADLRKPSALVHGIGGIGALDGIDDPATTEEPLASINDLAGFVRALTEARAIGGSIYDWRTTEAPARAKLRDLLAPFNPR